MNTITDAIIKFILSMNTNLWLAFLIFISLGFVIATGISHMMLSDKVDKIIAIIEKGGEPDENKK